MESGPKWTKRHRQAFAWFYRKRTGPRQSVLSRLTEFESSSIGDIAFLLLIFFIVTSSFMLKQGIFFSLPEKNSKSIRNEKLELVELVPAREGFRFQGVEWEREKLAAELRSRRENLAEGRDLVGVIIMSENLPYDRLVDSLSLLRETGIRKISLKNWQGGP